MIIIIIIIKYTCTCIINFTMICFDAPRHQQSHTSVENPDSLNLKKYFLTVATVYLFFFWQLI